MVRWRSSLENVPTGMASTPKSPAVERFDRLAQQLRAGDVEEGDVLQVEHQATVGHNSGSKCS